ncbi:MAG: hypothetical protein JO016_18930 [Actinobacteria bacterium]|nr:hypothetical protein [Actinomycetota bacterium]
MVPSSGGQTPPPLLTRLARWRRRILLVPVLGLATVGVLAAGAPSALAQSAQPAQASRPAAPATIPVGVQDGWINNCDSGAAPDYSAKGSVPAPDSPYWAALGMNTVRYSPPWDIASPHPATADGQVLAVEQACFGYWLKALGAKGVTPEIAFKPDYNYVSGHRIMIPSLSSYEAAIRAFVAAYSCPSAPAGALCPDGLARVSIIAPWGEPEFQGSGQAGLDHLPQYFYLQDGRRFDATNCPAHASDVNCGPALAAQMWVTVHHRCPSCTDIAGDFGSNRAKGFAYLAVYHKYLRDLHGGRTVYRPAVWAIHPYTDVIAYERHQNVPLADTLVGRYAQELRRTGFGSKTQIWLDEVSSFTVDFSGRHYSRATQALGAYRLLHALPRAGGASVPGEPVVTRIYYMRFAGETPDALIVGGQREPIYYTFANRNR